MNRLAAIQRFYRALETLADRNGGMQTLATCSGRLRWPARGVYFFFEPGENRRESGSGPRVVRIGTHALHAGSKTSLWNRLSQHAGPRSSGAGNHRGSIFRLLVGEALKGRDGTAEPASWGVAGHPREAAGRLGKTAAGVRSDERSLEQAVSRYIGSMPFLAVAVNDDAGPASLRASIERNAIALLSNYRRQPIDCPSERWLGLHSSRERVRESGLWNNNYVDAEWSDQLFEALDASIVRTEQLHSLA